MKIEITAELAKRIIPRINDDSIIEIRSFSATTLPSKDFSKEIVFDANFGEGSVPMIVRGESYREIICAIIDYLNLGPHSVDSFLTPEEIADAIYETTVDHRKKLIAAQIEAARKSGPEITDEALNIGSKSELFAAIESLFCEHRIAPGIHESDHGGALIIGFAFQGNPFTIQAPIFRKELDDVYRFIESELQAIISPKGGDQ